MTDTTMCTVAAPAALAADAQRRTISGLALPYGVLGRTSRGPVTVDAGAVAIPADLRRVKLFRDHRAADGSGTPVGYVAAASDTGAGLTLSFKVGPGPDGDLALSDAENGIRDALSVELSGVELSPDGRRVVRATLDGVALVAIPAFADARVHTVQAATPGPETTEDSMPDTTTDKRTETTGTAFAGDRTAETITAGSEVSGVVTGAPVSGPAPAPAPAAAPVGLHAARTEPRPLGLDDICTTLQAAHMNGGMSSLTAALADITRTANPWVSPDGWLGELWSGVAYERAVVPLLTPGALTHWKMTGWRWVLKPEVNDYTGDKTEVPTNPVTTESVPVEAKRLAGAHDLDRKFIDFNDQAFIASYFAAMAESYAYESDQRAATFVVASATAAGTAPDLLKAVAKGARSVKTNSRARATFALVNPADLETLLDINADQVPAFLELLGINPENFTDSDFVPAGTVVVGARPAATFYELPGSPIRVEAVDLARGGHDGALFGYYATLLHSAKGIAKVTITPTP